MPKPKFRKIKKQAKKQQKPMPKAQVQELTLLGKALRAGGGLAGGYLGGLFGPAGIAAGGSAGTSLGAAISKWLGAGDYSLNANSVVKGSNSVPGMHSNDQSTIIRHKEYITDIVTSATPGAFSSRSYSINPGLSSSYPWLAGIAQQYQEYRIKGMVYHFISTSGSSVGSTTTSLPTVIMATQYRVTAPDYEDKVTMLNAYFSCDDKASESFCHPIECDPKENPFNIQYVRGAAVPTGEDPKSYDLGKFQIATIGSQAASVNVGELWCTYEIELKKPYATAQLDLFQQASHFVMASADATNRLGVVSTINFNSLGVNMGSALTNTIPFPLGCLGKYLIVVWWNAKAITTAYTVTANNCTVASYWSGPNTNMYVTSAAVTGGGAFVATVIDVPNPNVAASWVLSGGASAGGGACDITICQIPDTFA